MSSPRPSIRVRPGLMAKDVAVPPPCRTGGSKPDGSGRRGSFWRTGWHRFAMPPTMQLYLGITKGGSNRSPASRNEDGQPGKALQEEKHEGGEAHPFQIGHDLCSWGSRSGVIAPATIKSRLLPTVSVFAAFNCRLYVGVLFFRKGAWRHMAAGSDPRRHHSFAAIIAHVDHGKTTLIDSL